MGCPQTREEMIARGMKPLSSNDKYSDDVRSKIKGSSSDKRKFAQKLSGLKNCNPENFEKYAFDLISNSSLTAFELIRIYKEIIDDENLNTKLRIELLGKMVGVYSALHGSKIQLDANINIKSLNIEVNLSRMAEQYAERMILKRFVEKWKTEFGEEQAVQMQECLEYKYHLERNNMNEIVEAIRKVFINAGNEHYKKKVDLEPVDENDYVEICQEVKV